MNELIPIIQKDVGLTKALAHHFLDLLLQDYVDLPRMEAYRLRRSLKKHNTEVLCTYGVGYYMRPEDKKVYQEWFNLPQTHP